MFVRRVLERVDPSSQFQLADFIYYYLNILRVFCRLFSTFHVIDTRFSISKTDARISEAVEKLNLSISFHWNVASTFQDCIIIDLFKIFTTLKNCILMIFINWKRVNYHQDYWINLFVCSNITTVYMISSKWFSAT